MSQILTPEQIKIEECKNKVQKIMEQYGCIFEPFFSVVGGMINQGVNIKPRPQLSPEEEQAMRESMGYGTQGGPNA